MQVGRTVLMLRRFNHFRKEGMLSTQAEAFFVGRLLWPQTVTSSRVATLGNTYGRTHLYFSTTAPASLTTGTKHSRDVLGAITTDIELTAPDYSNNIQELDNDDDDLDVDNDNDDSDLGDSVEHKSIKSSKLKKLYKGALKKRLLEDHGVTVDAKVMNWIIPWKMAVLIHCLETKQDYSIIMKRPGPTRNEIEKHIAQLGIRDTKENRLKARLEMKRKNKILAKQLLLKVVLERGHVMKHAPSTKSEWQDLYILVQEMVVQSGTKGAGTAPGEIGL